MATYLTLSEKVDLLLEEMRTSDGKKYTYEYIESLTGLKPSTLSRIRTGNNPDPMFRTVMAIAKVFHVRLAFFEIEMTRAEAMRYLQQPENVGYLDELHMGRRQQEQEMQSEMVSQLARRAALLEEEGVEVLMGVVNYVLKQRKSPGGKGQKDEMTESA